jgi:hypothetical protein
VAMTTQRKDRTMPRERVARDARKNCGVATKGRVKEGPQCGSDNMEKGQDDATGTGGV